MTPSTAGSLIASTMMSLPSQSTPTLPTCSASAGRAKPMLRRTRERKADAASESPVVGKRRPSLSWVRPPLQAAGEQRQDASLQPDRRAIGMADDCRQSKIAWASLLPATAASAPADRHVLSMAEPDACADRRAAAIHEWNPRCHDALYPRRHPRRHGGGHRLGHLPLVSRALWRRAYGAPFTLVDQNGAAITEAAFRGHPSVVFFGFTNCPEICPTTLAEMDGWLKQIGDEGKDIHAYFVSVDPERDTPEVMKTMSATSRTASSASPASPTRSPR